MGRQLTASEYLRHWRKNMVWTHLEWPKHRARLEWCADQCAGEKFADVGCALGHSTDIMRQRRPGAWMGIDFCANTVEAARRIFPDLAFMFCEHLEKLNTVGLFDSVVCSEVIEHVKDPASLLRQLVAMATKRVILTTPHIDAHDPGHVRIYNDRTISEFADGLDAFIEQDEVFYKIILEVGA